jgi:plastocyanin
MTDARRTARMSLLLVLLLAQLVVAAAAAAPAASAATVKHVTISNYTFTPTTITIKHGTKVVWKNTEGFDHHLASANSIKTTARLTGVFSSGLLGHGATFSFTYKKKGTFYYECTIHADMPSMHGKVIVK